MSPSLLGYTKILVSKDGDNVAVFSRVRTGTGRSVQAIGVILWVVSGISVVIWTLYVLFSVFGIWTIFVGLLLAPITYLASIFVVWFSTGVFPILLLVPYVASFVGIGLVALGSAIAGED